MDPLDLNEYEALAANRLDRPALDYYRGGADDEITLRESTLAWGKHRLLPRVLVDVSRVRTETTVLGTHVAHPILIAPTAYQCLADPAGECATARAAVTAETILIASTLATRSLEEIAAAVPGPRWFQLYVYKDRAVSERLVRRAEAAGYGALVLTVDTPKLGRRPRDVRNGFGLPPHLRLANFDGELAREPSHAPGVSGIALYAAASLDDSLTWEALAWLRSITELPLIVKGVLAADDARLAVEHGAAGVVVSNHGGRQLDGVVATADALPDVVAAVAGRAEVYVDGGIRRGTDVLKALALGARAVLLGRPILWGLAAAGEAGVVHVLSLLRAELELAMILAGRPTIASIDRSLLR